MSKGGAQHETAGGVLPKYALTFPEIELGDVANATMASHALHLEPESKEMLRRPTAVSSQDALSPPGCFDDISPTPLRMTNSPCDVLSDSLPLQLILGSGQRLPS